MQVKALRSGLLTYKDAILEKRTEHFNSVLNLPSSINDDAIERTPQLECIVLLRDFPTGNKESSLTTVTLAKNQMPFIKGYIRLSRLTQVLAYFSIGY